MDAIPPLPREEDMAGQGGTELPPALPENPVPAESANCTGKEALEAAVKAAIPVDGIEDLKLSSVRRAVETALGVKVEKDAVKVAVMEVLRERAAAEVARKEAAAEQDSDEAASSDSDSASSDSSVSSEDEAEDEEKDDGTGSDSEGEFLPTGESDNLSRFALKRAKNKDVPCNVRGPLAELLGTTTATRVQAARLVDQYIEHHKLIRDGKVYCDEMLQKVFHRGKLHIPELFRCLNDNLVPNLIRSARDQLASSSDDEDPERPRKPRKAKKGTQKVVKSKSSKASSTTAKPRGGFGKEPLAVSPILEEFVGSDRMTRPQVVKMIWDHVKNNNLQNPENRRELICDKALEKIFRRPVVTMFNMNSFLTVHLRKIEEVEASGFVWNYSKLDMSDSEWAAQRKSTPKKRRKASASADGPPPKRRGFGMVRVSDELSEIIGVKQETRGQVVKLIWQYIHEHELQNPEQKREILCDATLEHLFGRKTVTMFNMNKHLQKHLFKAEDSQDGAGDIKVEESVHKSEVSASDIPEIAADSP